jgi:hypothetical protein
MYRLTAVVLLSFVVTSLVSSEVLAQAPAPQPPAAPAPSIATDYRVLEMLVKNAVAAVNHANITGNYTVVRDLGTEAFRKKNSAAELAKIFAVYRDNHFDLSPILTSQPQFTQPPGERQPGRLQLVGYFPTQPQAVQFAITYGRTSTGWGIEELSLGVAPLADVLAPPTDQGITHPRPVYQAAAPHSGQYR